MQVSVEVITKIDNVFCGEKSEAKGSLDLFLLRVTDIWSYYTFLQIKKVSIRHVKSFFGTGPL